MKWESEYFAQCSVVWKCDRAIFVAWRGSPALGPEVFVSGHSVCYGSRVRPALLGDGCGRQPHTPPPGTQPSLSLRTEAGSDAGAAGAEITDTVTTLTDWMLPEDCDT